MLFSIETFAVTIFTDETVNISLLYSFSFGGLLAFFGSLAGYFASKRELKSLLISVSFVIAWIMVLLLNID